MYALSGVGMVVLYRATGVLYLAFGAVGAMGALIAIKSVAQAEGAALHFNLAVLIDTFAALSLGVFAAQRLEMYLRANRLLAEARA